MDSLARARLVRRVLLGILVLNWGVAAAKAFVGITSHSLSLVADAIHSTFDGASNIVGLITVTAAGKDPDSEHPYGHRKFEVVGAALIGMFLAVAALHIFESALQRFRGPIVPTVSLSQFLVLGGTLLVNIAITRYEARMGRLLKSSVLLADAKHTSTDVLATLAVMVSLVSAKMGIRYADPAIALCIAIYICWTAGRLIVSSSQILADRAILDPAEVERLVKTVPGVLDCHDVRTRGTDDAIYADLRIHVAAGLPLREAHELCHQVEERLREGFPGLQDIVVHPEPGDEHHA